ncbi:hypothetical protein [Ahrensia sp. R2A130]|uniref:hypothetical protein n=1 Tax=Ahrensia sp. R2A130 TaxID=744979 RepID=UPI001B3BBABD|nr:hypothetical protein [Ahrensia sp. R2A130]
MNLSHSEINNGHIHDYIVAFIALVIVVFAFIHIVVEFCWISQNCGGWTTPVNNYGYLFDVTKENSIPNWYSVVQLSLVAQCLAFIAYQQRKRLAPSAAWWGLALIFVYMSLDEATDMHGLWRLAIGDYTIPGTLDARFAWVIPGGIVVLVVAAAYMRWLLALPKETRWRFVLAGCVFLTGALVLETVGAFVADSTFRNTPYLIISALEELLEMAGILIMLHAVLRVIETKYRIVEVAA